jgi:hypothetical protein
VERRLRVFENGVLRKIFRPKRDEATMECRRLHNEQEFGPKRDEATMKCRRLHNEEPNNQYFSPNIIRVTKPGRRRGETYPGFW